MIPEGRRPTGAFVVALDAQGRVLMQLRDDRPGIVQPAHWSFFGGGVEAGETPRDAARREFAEETGIAVPAERLEVFFEAPSEHVANGWLTVFLLTGPVAPRDIRLGEGAGFGFLTEAQVETFHMADRTRHIARMALSRSADKKK